MYCINCGVKLADTEEKCPLCGTVVFHPYLERKTEEKPYPQDRYPAPIPKSRLAQSIMTGVFLLPLLLVLLADLQDNGIVTWSGFVIGALLVSYVIVVLPVWFQKPNPVIFVPCAFGAVGVYLLYISVATDGGWFLTFAFPVLGGVGLVVTAVVTLLRYVGKGRLYIFGGASIAMGGMTLLTEFLMDLTFGFPRFLGWSLYPLVTLVLLGGVLIFLAICRSAREVMERKLFI